MLNAVVRFVKLGNEAVEISVKQPTTKSSALCVELLSIYLSLPSVIWCWSVTGMTCSC